MAFMLEVIMPRKSVILLGIAGLFLGVIYLGRRIENRTKNEVAETPPCGYKDSTSLRSAKSGQLRGLPWIRWKRERACVAIFQSAAASTVKRRTLSLVEMGAVVAALRAAEGAVVRPG